MAQVRIDFQGCGKVETFPRARIQPMGDGVQFTLAAARQVRALGQVLAQEAIRILVGAALPGAVRIRKEDLDGEPLGQLLVLGHLFSPVIGQRFAQQRRDVPEFLGEALSCQRSSNNPQVWSLNSPHPLPEGGVRWRLTMPAR